MAFLLCGAFTFTTSLYAQSTTPSRISLSTGIGLVPTYFKAGEGSGMPPVSFKIGVDLTKTFSIGSFFGYSKTTSRSKEFADNYNSYLTNTTMVVGLRGEVKKQFGNRLGAYAGGMLGYTYANVKEFSATTQNQIHRASDEPTPFNPNEKKGKITYSALLGTTLKLTKRVNLYGEIGYGISLLNLGMTLRI